MLRLIFFACLSFVLPHNLGAQNFFSVKGKEIIDPTGKPILLKGTNLGNWLVPEGYMFKFKDASSPRLINQIFSELIGPAEVPAFWSQYLDHYMTKEDVVNIKKIGFNHVRLPFNYRMFSNESYMGQINPGFKYLDRMIGWCKEEGLYLLLDMHCAPGGQTGDNIDDGFGYPFLFENETNKEAFIAIWKKIAGHYKNNTTVMGYELLNEPIAHYFANKEALNPELEKLYKRATAAIREVDQNHLIFLGGAQWNTNFKVFGKPFDNKLVYTFHKYWMPAVQGEIQSYVDFSEQYQVPIYLGESGENTNDWINTFRLLLEKNNIGWCFWPYKKMDSDRNIVTFKKPEQYEMLSYYADGDHNSFERIRSHRPDIKIVKAALTGFLDSCKAAHCVQNEGYIKALGLTK
jgi:endoglucanase